MKNKFLDGYDSLKKDLEKPYNGMSFNANEVSDRALDLFNIFNNLPAEEQGLYVGQMAHLTSISNSCGNTMINEDEEKEKRIQRYKKGR